MSKVKYLFYADQRGSVNGSTFSRNRFAAISRAKVSPVNPSTGAQNLVRSNFGALSASFRGLGINVIAAWNAAAANFARTNIFGDTFIPTGLNLYVMLNSNLLQVGAAELTDPPAPVELGVFDMSGASMTVTFGAITQALPTAVKFLGSSTLDAGYAVQVYATAPYSPGRQLSKNQLRWIGNVAGGGSLTADLIVPYVNKFGALTGQAGQKVSFAWKATKITTGQNTGIVSLDTLVEEV